MKCDTCKHYSRLNVVGECEYCQKHRCVFCTRGGEFCNDYEQGENDGGRSCESYYEDEED